MAVGSPTVAATTTLRIRSTDDGSEIHRIKTQGHCVAVAITEDGKRLVTADSDGFILVLETGTWQEVARFRCSTRVGGGLHLASGDCVISGHRDGRIRVWDIETLTCLHTLKGHASEVSGIALHPDGTTMASCSSDGTVRLWNLRTWSEIGIVHQQTTTTNGCVFTTDGRRLIVSSRTSDPKIGSKFVYRVWDVPEIDR